MHLALHRVLCVQVSYMRSSSVWIVTQRNATRDDQSAGRGQQMQ